MSTYKQKLAMIPAACFAALLMAAGCATPGAVTDQGGAVPGQVDQTPVVKDIRSSEEKGSLILTVEGNHPLNYSIFKLEDPLRLALDLPGADLGDYNKNIPVNKGPASFIKPLPADKEKAGSVARLEIFLSRPATYEVKVDGVALNIVLTEGAPAGAPSDSGAVIASSPSPSVSDAGAASGTSPSEAGRTEAASPSSPAGAPQGKQATRVTMLDVVSSPEGSQVIIEGDGWMDYEYFLVESKSVVVDIYGVTNSISPLARKVSDEYISQIRVGEHFEPRKKVRVVMDLVKPSEYKLVSLGEKILVNFGALAQEPDEKLRASLSNVVTDVYFRPMENRSLIEIVSTKPPDYQKIDSEDPNRLILEVANSRVSPEAQKTLELGSLNREIGKIVCFQYKKDGVPVARIVAQFKESSPYRIEVKGNRILIDIPRAQAAVSEAPVPPAGIRVEQAVASAPAPAAGNAAEPAAAAPMETVVEVRGGPPVTKYTGRKLSLDFKDADIADVMRLIAEVSGVNFVSGTEVKGKVTIRLADVPWDQALDVILKANTPPLTQIREAENIIRITTLDNVRREESERQRLEDDREKRRMEATKTEKVMEPLVTKSFHISYAKVEDIKSRVESFMSERRKTDAFLQSDARTNTLIVKDMKANLEEIEKIIRDLDTPTPAVQIEARIVTVSSDNTRNLGIQWGFNYVADQAHGNPTQFQFPNSINVGGTAAGAGSNTVVNLPASNPTSAIGLTFGHIANTLTLDLKISAMEEMGQLEILSNPKIFVVQNEKAIINVGQQLPVPKTDAEGNRTVEFKDVGIKLEVTPQVTADNRVFLDVQVERSRKGADVKTTEGEQFSIDTERAQTKVLLNDGETSVIGGLFQQTKESTKRGTPGLSKIPILGFLFRSKSTTDSKDELLIFLTPKVVRP